MDDVISAYACAVYERRGFSNELRTLAEVPLVAAPIPDTDDEGGTEAETEEEHVDYTGP